MENRDALIELFNVAEEARLIYERLGMTNTAGLTAAQRVDLDLRYEKARRSSQQLQSAYQAALKEASET